MAMKNHRRTLMSKVALLLLSLSLLVAAVYWKVVNTSASGVSISCIDIADGK